MNKPHTLHAIAAAVLMSLPFAEAIAKENVNYPQDVARKSDPESVSNQMNMELHQKIQADLWKTIDIASRPMTAVKNEVPINPDNILAGTKNRMLRALR